MAILFWSDSRLTVMLQQLAESRVLKVLLVDSPWRPDADLFRFPDLSTNQPANRHRAHPQGIGKGSNARGSTSMRIHCGDRAAVDTDRLSSGRRCRTIFSILPRDLRARGCSHSISLSERGWDHPKRVIFRPRCAHFLHQLRFPRHIWQRPYQQISIGGCFDILWPRLGAELGHENRWSDEEVCRCLRHRPTSPGQD
jgi:hypothetical protein